jgi:lysophospholipase L1-like esterase
MLSFTLERYSAAIARVLLMAGTLVIIEIGLQLLSFVSVRVQAVIGPEISYSLPDAVLGGKGNPKRPDHDVAGYRNTDQPDSAGIVVLGDSHTYGVAVSRDEAWPHVLEASLGQRVYNMAYPGYSPAQSLLQLKQALSFKPHHIVVSVYFGNDFIEAFNTSQWNSAISNLAPPDLLRESRIKEAESPLHILGNELYMADESANDVPGYATRLRSLLSSHSRLYGLMRAAKNFARPPTPSTDFGATDFDTVIRLLPPAKLRYWMITDQPNWRAILTTRSHAFGMNDRDVRVRLGVEIVKRALKSIAEQTRAEGVELLVVLLPTKDTVFWPHTNLKESVLSELVATEARLKEELIGDLNSQRIDVVNATEPLRKAPRQPYFETADSHPNALGHRVIADVVAARLAASDNTARGVSAATKPQ